MIHTGDCIAVMAGMSADSVDAVVTDPPYGLEFMGKSWDKFWTAPKVSKPEGRIGSDGVRRTKTSPSSQHTPSPTYVAGSPFQAWCEAWGREALRVTRPGGYLLAFGGTRTHHRLVCGLEDAGWIIRDERLQRRMGQAGTGGGSVNKTPKPTDQPRPIPKTLRQGGAMIYMSRKDALAFVSHNGEIHVVYQDDSVRDAIWLIRSTPIKNVSFDPHWRQKEQIAKTRRELQEAS